MTRRKLSAGLALVLVIFVLLPTTIFYSVKSERFGIGREKAESSTTLSYLPSRQKSEKHGTAKNEDKGKSGKSGKSGEDGEDGENGKNGKSGEGGKRSTARRDGKGGPSGQSPPKKALSYHAPVVYKNTTGSSRLSSENGNAVVDFSNASQGYIMVKVSGIGIYDTFRVRVQAPGGNTKNVQDYPFLKGNFGKFEAVPLTAGRGDYKVTVYAHPEGAPDKSYEISLQLTVNAALSSSNAPYLRPNIYSNYSASSSCVRYAAELTRGCDTDVAKIEALYGYVIRNFVYDDAKAARVASIAYLPNLEEVWASKKGICLDYASVLTAMLRTQGIMTKLETGDSDAGFHAWIRAYSRDTGKILGVIEIRAGSFKLLDPTFGAVQNRDWSDVKHITKNIY